MTESGTKTAPSWRPTAIPFHVAVWPAAPPLKGRVVVLARRPEPFRLVSLARPDAGRGGLSRPRFPTAAARARTRAIAAMPLPAAGWSATSPSG